VLTWQRIVSERLNTQDETIVDFPCDSLPETLERLGVPTMTIRQAVSKYLMSDRVADAGTPTVDGGPQHK